MTSPYYVIVRCLCQNPAEYYCNTCGDSLCANCKPIHVGSKAIEHHSVVPYAERLIPSHVTFLFCTEHTDNKCTLWCERCEDAACTKCVTTTHRSHEFTDIELIVKKKRGLIQQRLNHLESNNLKEWEDLMEKSTQTTSVYLEDVSAVDRKLDERAEEFNQNMNDIVQRKKNQLEDMKSADLVILRRQEEKVLKGLQSVKEEIKECEELLRNGDMTNLLKYTEIEQNNEEILPTVFNKLPPPFTHGLINTKSLINMFGTLGSTEPLHVSEDISDSERCSDSATGKTVQMAPMPSPVVQSSLTVDYNWPVVVSVESGRAWVRTHARQIQLLDRHGNITNTKYTDFYFNDCALSPQGDILFTVMRTNFIKSVSREKGISKTLFQAPWEPHGLCCRPNGDIVVTFLSKGKVIVYNRSGDILQEVGSNVVKYPYSVAVNNVNTDLYIIDKEQGLEELPGKVVALDNNYRLRYQYKGLEDIKFYPSGLSTDHIGNILITDRNNNRVHILDKNGHFPRYLVPAGQGFFKPLSIRVDSEGSAWVTELNGRVKIVTYLKYCLSDDSESPIVD